MRYTRYEYKKSSKIKFLCNVAIIIGISIGSGVYISNFIFAGKHIQDNNSDNLSYSTDKDYEGAVPKIMALQCGYYSKEENAKELITSISKYCTPFIVEDNGKYRVLAGIYKNEDGLKKMDELKSSKIDVAKINLNISSDNIENKEILEITDGFLTIVGKLQEASVKSIKTTEFKEWADKVINDSNGSKSKKIDDLSIYIKNLPDEINKIDSNSNIQELYKLINT